jgi:general secretion pathway protein I
MRTRPGHGEAGFTLLEVLVAFVIAALALGVLFSGALSGLRASRVAGHYNEAVALARSHLATLAADNALAARDLEGDDGGGFHWRGRIAPISAMTIRRSENETANGSPPLRATLFGISVVESWKSDGPPREVRLESARLALVPEG